MLPLCIVVWNARLKLSTKDFGCVEIRPQRYDVLLVSGDGNIEGIVDTYSLPYDER
jgi:hypothetical protein